MRTLIVVVAVAAIGAAGCSSSKSATPKTVGPTEPATTATVAVTTTTTGTFTGASDSPFCAVAKHDEAAFAISNFMTKTPPQLKSIYTNIEPALEEERSEAPAAIKSDVTAYVAALRDLLAPLASADYNFENLNPTTYANFATRQITAASVRIERYLEQVCKSAPA